MSATPDSSRTGPVPVTVLTGFLGAGKTTLLNHILSEQHGRKYAVLVNEFGELGVDNDLVVDADEEIFEMNNGCVCCTVRGDLIRILGSLLRRRGRFDGIIIETTGLADPAPVAQTFFVDDNLRGKARLDAVIAVVDALNILKDLDDSPEALNQIAFADVIVLNKIDLANETSRCKIINRIREINAVAAVHETERGHVPLTYVLNIGGFDLQRALGTMPDFLDTQTHQHEEGIVSISLSVSAPVQQDRFNAWIGTVLQEQGADILRAKGILYFENEERRFAFQAVHMMADGDFIGPIKPDEKAESRLVFIGRNLNRPRLRRGFESCLAV